MPDIAFDVQNVSYAYDRIEALTNTSLQIRRGERIALIGANGSGKSTLLRLLAGLSFADTGQIYYSGELLNQNRLEEQEFFLRYRRSVGVVFQNPDIQLFNASVFDEVAFGPLQLGWPRPAIREQVEKTLLAMGVADLKDRAPHRLSGGEKKRVAIASVLVLDPEILLLDEPTAALDPASHAHIVELLTGWADGSKTVVMATHDLETLEDIADRCYVLKNGRVVGEAEPISFFTT